MGLLSETKTIILKLFGLRTPLHSIVIRSSELFMKRRNTGLYLMVFTVLEIKTEKTKYLLGWPKDSSSWNQDCREEYQ